MSDKAPASRQLLNITKALLDHAEAECERLRTESGGDSIRNAIIEECAQVAFETAGSLEERKLIAAAIRALKDRP